MARNFYRIFTENNPVMGDSKTFGIPEAKGLKSTANQKKSIQTKCWGLNGVFDPTKCIQYLPLTV